MTPARTAFCAGTAAAAMGLGLHLSAAAPNAEAVDAMEIFLARPASPHQYQASRRLEASGSGHRGWIDVQTSVTTASGLQYEVMAEGGSRYIRTRVLRSLLDEERRLIATGRTSRVAISKDNFELVRVEGRLAKNPSFWVTRVDVVRSYQRIDGVVMPVSLDTKAQLRFFGSSGLRMTYRYSHIDDRLVSDPEIP